MSRKRKKNKHHEEHMDESWLIPYADLLTLLLALFIVLFASSTVDAVKFKQISDSFETIFSGGTGVMSYPNATPPQDASHPVSKDERKRRNNSGGGNVDQKALKEMKDQVDQYISMNHLSGSLKANLSDEGLLITITNDVLFDSGSAIVKPEERNIAKQISNVLVSKPIYNVIVSGHTDNLPIKNELFESNWDLSVSRAVNFMKVLLENKNLKPQLFSAKGYGEFKPIASNNTPANRAKNRRVEILVLPNHKITNP
jgi:chemotaxis protein MotB